MKFSVIMASRLIDYPGAAHDRDKKLIRAIASVMEQSFEDRELLVIADGCVLTKSLVTKYIEDDRVRLLEIEHTKLWSGGPRNKGIEEAKGEFVTYLDIDDVLGENHLQTINSTLGSFDWVWYNDLRYKPREDYWYENQCDIRTLGMCGTSNITHKKDNVRWDVNGKYAHDYHFIQKLLTIKNHSKVTTPEYYVCHIPGGVTSGGYDL